MSPQKQPNPPPPKDYKRPPPPPPPPPKRFVRDDVNPKHEAKRYAKAVEEWKDATALHLNQAKEAKT